MIPVTPADEPTDFETRVRQPGLAAIDELTGRAPSRERRRARKRKKIADKPEDIPAAKFPPFWRNVLDDMLVAYDRRCAYLALHIEHGTGNPTVDHVIPKSKAWHLVYEWKNYRLAAGLINSKKGNVDDVLDPFEIGEDWFAMEFVAFQVVLGSGAVGDIGARVKDTIIKLGLNRDECCKARQAYFDNYLDSADPLPLAYVERRAPFVAREMRRQSLLRIGDQ
jgi:5-methylcytosine-specific restriction endonuclease McrA